MSQIWTIKGRLVGSFFLATQERRNSSSMAPVEGLKRLRIEPDLDDDGNYTGAHRVEADIEFVEDAHGHVQAEAVDDRARRLLDTVASLASFGTGRAVEAIGSYSAHYQSEDDPPQVRNVGGRFENAAFDPPARLSIDVLSAAVPDRLRRVIRWWARGMASSDAVDKLVSFGNAVNHISAEMDQAPGRTNTCPNCGYTTTMKPGDKQKVIYFLKTVGVDETLAADVYESRNMVSHAGSDLDRSDMHRFHDHADVLAHALHTGIANELGIEVAAMPTHLPVIVESAFVEITAEGQSADASDD